MRDPSARGGPVSTTFPKARPAAGPVAERAAVLSIAARGCTRRHDLGARRAPDATKTKNKTRS